MAKNTDINFYYDTFKKQFVIYNRTENNDISNTPKLDTSQNRNCFLFDPCTRSVFKNTEAGEQQQLIGNTYFGSIGKHNEVHNDYSNNMITNTGSYGTVIGLNNILDYANDGGLVAGRYNKSDVSYLFSIGNGKNDDNRSNIIVATDSSVFINGDLHINGKSLSEAGSSEEVKKLESRVTELENQLTSLTTELSKLTFVVEDDE